MARSGWRGLADLTSLAHLPWLQRPRPNALVLSGGGARASFQIGSLRCLYDRTDFTAQIITGTSAGSILAAMLAQYATHAEQAAAVGELEQIWRSLTAQSDMFAERRWYSRLRSVSPDLERLLPAAADSAPTPADSALEPRRSWFSFGRQRVEPDQQPVGPDQHFHPLLGFQPEQPYPAGNWSMAQVRQLFGQLPELGRAGGDLPGIVRGAERTRSMYRPGPILRQLLSPATFQPARVAASGVTLRIATVCLDTGQVRYLTETGHLVDRDNEQVDEPRQDLVMGILASCSIPSVFAPVPLGQYHYVDGGVRENLPAEMAIGHLRAIEPYCLVSGPSGLAERRSDESLVSILFRTADIMTDEVQRDEVAYARSAGGRVIEPEFSVHDAMTVDPGLIAINLDYGWMRAQEVLDAADDEVRRLHRDLTVARNRAWSLENSLFGPDADLAPDDALAATSELTEQRETVRRLVAAAPAESLPAGAAEWGTLPERHPYDVPR